MKHPMPGQPSFWLSYVNVDDIHAATPKAKLSAATIIRDVMPVAEMGWPIIFIDPTEAPLGLRQMKKA